MYRIGDFYVNIVSKHNHIVKRAEKYKIECEVVADFQIIPDRYAQVDSSLYPDENIMEYCLLGDNFAEKVLSGLKSVGNKVSLSKRSKSDWKRRS